MSALGNGRLLLSAVHFDTGEKIEHFCIRDTVVVSNEPRSIIFSYSTFRVWFIFSETYLAVT